MGGATAVLPFPTMFSSSLYLTLFFFSASAQVLEHAHRPLHLRKGDFYSYLSLSSHDSDCGEVSQCSEDKSSTPTPYSIPVYATPTQGLHSPSAETFTSTSRQAWRAGHLKSPGNPEGPLLSPEVRDEETLFPACTEEVYLGPPLCYSVSLAKKPRRLLMEGDASLACNGFGSDLSSEGTASHPDRRTRPSALPACYWESSPGEEARDSSLSSSPAPSDCPSPVSNAAAAAEKHPRLLRNVAESVGTPREERSHNEGPSYLNPRARVTLIDSSAAAECSPHAKALESNMGAVMTKISVCGSATNPSKEPLATAAHINPKINCSPMREADTEEEQGAKRRDEGRRRRSSARQEAAPAQVSETA